MATATRTRMIEATARLIQARGVHGTSLNDILAASGAPRGSLYFHFPGGKPMLVLEAVQAVIEVATKGLEACLRQARSPAEGVRAFFELAAREMVETDYGFGCPVAPVVLDAPSVDSELAEACRAAFQQWTRMYCEALVSAGVEAGRADRLAKTILASLEGALLIARSERSTAALEEIGAEMADVISATLP